MANVKTRIIQKHDSSANWAKATTFVPLKGEIIIYDDLGKVKIGDGTTKVNDLQFLDKDAVKQVKLNNVAKSPNADGVVDLGTVITAHQDISGKQDKLSTAQLNAANSGITSAKVEQYNNYNTTISNHTTRLTTLEGKPGLDKTGTVSSIKINGTSKTPTNGAVDLGTVITSHQDISGKQDKLNAAQLNAANSGITSDKVKQYDGYNSTIGNHTTRIASLEGKPGLDKVGTVVKVNNTAPDASGNVSIPIPAAVSEATVSGWGFTKNTGTYSKPSGGIPKTDLASAVQTSLNNADSAVKKIEINGVQKTPTNGLIDLGNVISLRHNTSSEWIKTTDFVPLLGETILYDDLGRIKIGDGVSDINRLPFIENMNLPSLMGRTTAANIWDICHLSTGTIEDVVSGQQFCKFNVDNLTLTSNPDSAISAHNLGLNKPGIAFIFPSDLVSIHIWGICSAGSLEQLNANNALFEQKPTKFDIRWNTVSTMFEGSIDTILNIQSPDYVVPFLSVLGANQNNKNVFIISTEGVQDTSLRSCIVNIEFYYQGSGNIAQDKTAIQIVNSDPTGENTNEVNNRYTFNVYSTNINSYVSDAINSNTSIVKTSGTQTITGQKTFSKTDNTAPIKIINWSGDTQNQEELEILSYGLKYSYQNNGNLSEKLLFPEKGTTSGNVLTLATTDDVKGEYEVFKRTNMTSGSYSLQWTIKSQTTLPEGATLVIQISSGSYQDDADSMNNKSVFVWKIPVGWNSAQDSEYFYTETSTYISSGGWGIDGAVMIGFGVYEGKTDIHVMGRNANSTPGKVEFWTYK